MRGRPRSVAPKIEARAMQMRMAGEYVNKSRIARELHVPIRTVFRVLQGYPA